MGTFFKLMVVVTLFLASNGASVFGYSEQSKKGETSQAKGQQTISKSSEYHETKKGRLSRIKQLHQNLPAYTLDQLKQKLSLKNLLLQQQPRQ
ncbi:hypothetical protein [Enterococcus viikkiensis]|uniref:hypothetical protein n=1 Tax=Enterococcus viikkiensis TaxID=930854 RepID=UPI0010F6E431|nr:hypothetical protein [Enterococcus viikkiensis]